jgi:hypothetical protein
MYELLKKAPFNSYSSKHVVFRSENHGGSFNAKCTFKAKLRIAG